ncbi:hypothetical protein [Blastochloris tepida]|uniref:Uncharacterized protein n=1 Tax=Blastochloris tepida TaxID=2233851 RepID=A0A348G4K1_9HYPH|nr:hypothetical protein [Blastochloris tepida]BBF94484.1 hypothetical protein BLTE_31690 [Blastochloris tepida]
MIAYETTPPVLPSLTLPAALLSPSLPAGYETAWSFLARTEPWVLGLMTDPVRGLVADDLKARRVADDVGLPAILLPASDDLNASGFNDIVAAPTAVWHIVFPENP